MKQKQQERFKKFAVREADFATIAPRFIAGTNSRKTGQPAKRAAEICRPLCGFDIGTVRGPSAEALGHFQSSAARTLPAPMLTVFLHFLRAALTDLSFGLEWNDPAPILRNFVPVGTMIRATISAGGQTVRRN